MIRLENKEEIFDVINGDDVNKKLLVLQKLEDCSDHSIIEPLVKVLEKEKVIVVKERIMIILNRLIPISQFKFVEIMLRSSDPFVRNGIVEIIKRSEVPIIDFLENLAEDDDKDVRKFVIDSLSQENSPKVRKILNRRLYDKDVNIIYTAIEYLGNFRDKESAIEIEKILFESENLMVICSGLLALSKINYSPDKDRIIDFFKNHDNPMIFFPFLKYLKTFGTEDVFDFIEDLLEHNEGIYTKEIIDAIQGIIKNNNLISVPETLFVKLELIVKSNSNETNRYELLKILSRLKGSNSLPELRNVLKERNEIAKLAAIEIIGDIGDETDIERLEELAEDTESDELLEAIGDAVDKISSRIGV